jgi:hypothetical protein
MTRGARAALAAAALAFALAPGCAPVQPQGATSAAQPVTPPHAAGGAPAHGGSATGGTHDGASGATSRHGVPVGNTASGGSILANGEAPAVVDSGPSADAIAVLASIPEPLSAADRVPAPGTTGARGEATATSSKTTGAQSAPSASRAGAGAAAPGGAAAAGSAAGSASGAAATGAGAAAGAGAASGAGAAAGAAAAGGAAAAAVRSDSTSAAADSVTAPAATDTLIPTPEPTQPLGEGREAFAKAVSDTTSAPPPPPPPAQAPAKSEPDSCWRIQVAAPTEKKEADLKREAATSVLLVPFEIVHEKQRYKVRNTECLTRDAADRLRRRALQSGFTGAFPVVEVKK